MKEEDDLNRTEVKKGEVVYNGKVVTNEEEEEEERAKEYEFLKKQLPYREIKNTPNLEKFKEIMQKINNIKYYGGGEFEGCDLAAESYAERLLKEAQNYCEHELKITYTYTYTSDARKKIIRTISCEKCKLEIKDEAKEELVAEWI
jgi:Skp family chaperone for outer membrane proteins